MKTALVALILTSALSDVGAAPQQDAETIFARNLQVKLVSELKAFGGRPGPRAKALNRILQRCPDKSCRMAALDAASRETGSLLYDRLRIRASREKTNNSIEGVWVASSNAARAIYGLLIIAGDVVYWPGYHQGEPRCVFRMLPEGPFVMPAGRNCTDRKIKVLSIEPLGNAVDQVFPAVVLQVDHDRGSISDSVFHAYRR
jgi:hypothetical protein